MQEGGHGGDRDVPSAQGRQAGRVGKQVAGNETRTAACGATGSLAQLDRGTNLTEQGLRHAQYRQQNRHVPTPGNENAGQGKQTATARCGQISYPRDEECDQRTLRSAHSAHSAHDEQQYQRNLLMPICFVLAGRATAESEAGKRAAR